MSCAERASRSRGHLLGGLFLPALALLAVVPVTLAGCGPTGSTGQAIPADLAPAPAPFPNPLGVYRELGYIAGDRDFAAVGSFAYLPGPGDSSYTIVSLSFPNSTLRFRRDPPDFVARYSVHVIIGDTAAAAAVLSETEEVRVSTFRETSRRDESVVFQGFLKLVPGEYPTRIEVRDLASSANFKREMRIQVPRFAASFVTPPIIVYRAEPRPSRHVPPSLIVNPRKTLDFAGVKSQIYVESDSGGDAHAILEIREDGLVILTDTLAFRPVAGPLRTATKPLNVTRLPPGELTLQVRLPGLAEADSTALLVAMLPDWVTADYQAAIGYLRYAGTPAQLDSLANAPPRERAQLLHAFWGRKDSVPETPENEFFERYFRRIRDANDRFGEAATAGWLTDRGAVYITFGPPDEVLRHLEPGQGPERSQVWLYDKSLGFELRLVFYDPTATGAYTLTTQSRRAFVEAVQTLYS